MTKSVVLTTCVACYLSTAVLATAADQAPASHTAVATPDLARLGLGGLEPLSDQQGLTIRGRAVIGDVMSGLFLTASSSGTTALIDHNLKTHTTTILLHPQEGKFTVPLTK